MATAILETGATQRIEAAQTYTDLSPVDLRLLSSQATNFYSTLRDASHVVDSIRSDGRYSDEYKAEKIERVKAAAEQEAATILGRVADRTDRVVGAYVKALELDPPDMDGTLLEAKMANAKHDVELAVKGADTAGDVLDIFEALINEGDPVTVHLLLSTRYGERLLQSLGEESMAPVWRQKQDVLKRALKGGAAPRGVDAAQRLRHLPSLLEHFLLTWKQSR